MSRAVLPQQGIIYILELERPLGSARHSARYYCGWCTDLDARLHEHRTGRGARMLAAAVERGIGFQVVHTFPGTRADERRLKNQKSMPRIVQRLRKPASCTLPALAPARASTRALHERWCALAANCYARWQSGLASEHVYRAALHHLHRIERALH